VGVTSKFPSIPKPIFGISKNWKLPSNRIVMHVDMNSYFASVEQAHRPLLKEKPVLVLADPCGTPKGRRSVVAAASYEAKVKGVKAGMPTFEALKLAPNAILIGGNPHKYATFSRHFLKIFEKYTDLVEPYSIDEAFLDVTKTAKLFGDAKQVGRRIKDEIKKELGITCSVGIAPNKLVAKMASNWQKPDGLVIVLPDELPERLWSHAIEEIPGIGPRRKIKLNALSIRTIGELAKTSPDLLRKRFGITGQYMYNAAWGLDDGQVKPMEDNPLPKSLNRSITLSKNTMSPTILRATFLTLCDKVTYRLRQQGLLATRVGLILRFSDLTFSSKQRNLGFSTSDTKVIFREVTKILKGYFPLRLPVRLVGVTVSGIIAEEYLQPSLLPEFERDKKMYKTVDKIKEKFGEECVFYGGIFPAQKYLSHRLPENK